jgi:hypothetical protein
MMSDVGVAIEASSVEKSALSKPEPGEVTVPHTSDSHHLGQRGVLCCSLKDGLYANSLRTDILTTSNLYENLLTISAQIW